MAIRTLSGTLTIPSTEPATNGNNYDDLQIQLYLVENGEETLIDYSSIQTTNTYGFEFEDEEKQALIKIVRISTSAVLSSTVARGVLPRSFLIPSSDMAYYTDEKTSNYTYDSGLAILATSGGRFFSLAKEITNGILAADQGEKIPFKVNHIAPAGNGVTPAPDLNFKTGTIAAIAYSLGYYLEKNPYATNVTLVGQYLYKLLQHLAVNQNIGLHGGLVTVGIGRYFQGSFENDYIDNRALTHDSIMAYFAFKQAGRVLHSAYLQAASDLYDVIMEKLWVSGTTSFLGGRETDGVPISDNLETNFLGVYMLKEEGELIKANALLNRIEANYTCLDPVTQANGYKATTGSTEVWMEGSYAVAIAYRKLNNTTKYGAILKNLNGFLQADGSFQYGTIKDGQYEVKNWESVGATAWSYMANRLATHVFTTRDTASITSGIGNYYVNARAEGVYNSTACPTGYTASDFLFWVPVGYYHSTVSQSLVDTNATDRVFDNGQSFADTYGECVADPIFFNEEQSDFYQKMNCPAGFTGSFEQYTVPAGTYGSAISQQDADDQALADLDANGPAYANANGDCVQVIGNVSISVVLSAINTGVDDELYVTAYASQPVNTNVMVFFNYTDSNVSGSSSITIPTGAYNSYSQYLDTVAGGTGQYYTATINAVDPTGSGTQSYTY